MAEFKCYGGHKKRCVLRDASERYVARGARLSANTQPKLDPRAPTPPPTPHSAPNLEGDGVGG